jgi:hypothetical protein
MAEADASTLVADDDECREAEAAAALHHLGDAVDMDELVDELAVALFAAIPVAIASPTATAVTVTAVPVWVLCHL